LIYKDLTVNPLLYTDHALRGLFRGWVAASHGVKLAGPLGAVVRRLVIVSCSTLWE